VSDKLLKFSFLSFFHKEKLTTVFNTAPKSVNVDLWQLTSVITQHPSFASKQRIRQVRLQI